MNATPAPWRIRALEGLEEAVGHYLHRHDAPDLRGAYIEAREAKIMTENSTVDQELAKAREELSSQVPEVQDILEKAK